MPPFALPRVRPESQARAVALMQALDKAYPDAHCELSHASHFQLLIAVILSAQTTDVAVNKITPALFAKFPDAAALAKATPEEVQPFIRTIGLFRNKAKNIVACAEMLMEKHGGEVPRNMEALLELPGVARKTANVVMGECFNAPEGVVVDTHVARLSVRLGLAAAGANPAQIEKRLMALLPRDLWAIASHRMIFHGRGACSARGGACADHPVCREFGKGCERKRL
ncbi:MAG: endonuclease III [Planctomycetes bacterium]|nr:endonuclease III [Planctomycetota bacterium]